ncbi:MAG: thiol-activated cytolysin family protein [Ignavibacteriales bacterium]|nr:thiol-activated cytolysin family protein [Ignavibacteriales bacterium]
MKLQIKFLLSILVVTLMIITSCSEDGPTSIDTEKNAADIQEYISKLSYNPEEILNYQNTGGEESTKDILQDTSETITSGNNTIVCRTTTYNLKKNFDNIAILRPTNGIVWPGALVKGNGSLMDGVPEAISIERAPITISVNLPGMGENGIRTVKNPAASSVQAAIDSSLDWWNNNAYEEGYVNAANSSFRLTTSYSSKQLSLDVDLNAEWATGAVSSQFNYTSDEEKLVVMAVFKQAFYDVIFDTPISPEKVFSEETTLSKVQSVINDATAPAYIKSVTYGRIIMFRMETTNTFKSADVQAAFEYAAGFSVDGSLKSTYDEILQESSIDLVTIGGNAAVATEPISSASSNSATTILQKIQSVISGENALYSKNNPGVPIGYSVFYLKDNSLAKLGYTTEYTANECVTTQNFNTFKIYLGNFSVIKDCDGVEGGGEFYFKVQFLDENNNVLANGFNKYLDVSDPYNYLINQTKTFTMPRTIGKKVVVKLICYESDKDILGNVYYDSRMNGATISGIHSYNSNGTWSGTSPSSRSIEIGKDTNCNVKLHYSITYQ